MRLSASFDDPLPAGEGRITPRRGPRSPPSSVCGPTARKRVELLPESVNERDTLKPGPWVKGSVLLLDLGFYKHQAFARIEENGGLLPHPTPAHRSIRTIVRSLRVHRAVRSSSRARSWREVHPSSAER